MRVPFAPFSRLWFLLWLAVVCLSDPEIRQKNPSKYTEYLAHEKLMHENTRLLGFNSTTPHCGQKYDDEVLQ